MKSYRLLLLDSKGRLLGSRSIECMSIHASRFPFCDDRPQPAPERAHGPLDLGPGSWPARAAPAAAAPQ